MIVDVQGRQFAVGQRVAVASKQFKTDGLHVVIKTVTRVEQGRVYLDNSPQALRFPARTAIVSG